jgi:hypothetical protein
MQGIHLSSGQERKGEGDPLEGAPRKNVTKQPAVPGDKGGSALKGQRTHLEQESHSYATFAILGGEMATRMQQR